MRQRSLAPALSLLVLLLSTGPASALSSVTLVPSQTTLRPGETVQLDIFGNFSDPIVGWGLDLIITPDHLSPVGTPSIGGSWMGVSGADGDGLAGAAFPTGLSGDVLLASVILMGDSQGVSMLSLAVTPNDPTEGFAFDPDFSEGFDTFALAAPIAITVVPEPASAALLGLGLFSIALRRRGDPRAPGRVR